MSYTGGIKVAAPLSQGVFLYLQLPENLNTPLASRVTVNLPWARPGTSAVSKLNHWVLVVYSIVAILTGRLNLLEPHPLKYHPGE